jgi:carboxylesterase type B
MKTTCWYALFRSRINRSKNVMFLGYEAIGNQVLDEYPCSVYDASDCRVALSELIGDFWLVCPTMLVQNAYEKIENVYSYIFAHHPSWVAQQYLGNRHFCKLSFTKLGAYHSSEIQFVFNTLGIFDLPYTAQEQTLGTSDRLC